LNPAALIADWLKENKPQAKLIVLDANPDIVAEKENFSQAFSRLYAKVIEYRTAVEISSVDTSQMTLSTNGGLVRADVVNLIPPHDIAPDTRTSCTESPVSVGTVKPSTRLPTASVPLSRIPNRHLCAS
jgi:hypothetical protein